MAISFSFLLEPAVVLVVSRNALAPLQMDHRLRSPQGPLAFDMKGGKKEEANRATKEYRTFVFCFHRRV